SVSFVQPEVAVVAPQEILSKKSTSWKMYGAVTALMAGVCALLYAWTLDFPMVFDDFVYLQTNPLVRDTQSFGYMSDLREFATRPAKMGLPPDLATNFILRPVAYATFHLNYLLDAFSPRWYRAANIVVHATNGVLMFALVLLLLGGAKALPRRSSFFIALVSSLLFVAHPLATESVTYIVQRFTSLGASFFLATLCLYFAVPYLQSRGLRWGFRAAAVVSLILGMLTKESTFTAPVVAVMLDWLVVRKPLLKSLKHAVPLLLCMPIIPSLVILAAWAQNGDGVTFAQAVNLTNLNDKPWAHYQYFITQMTVVVEYLRRLIWPTGLNLDPEWPLYESLLKSPVLQALGVIITMLAAGGWLFKKFRTDVRAACVLACVLWYFGTIIVSSGLVPLPDLMAEHRAYLPSIGIFIAIACFLDWFRSWDGARRCGQWLAPLAAATAVVALCCATLQRNEVWRTAVSLWQDTNSKSPGSARVWGNLGAAYTSAERYDEAIPCYKKAIEIEPQYQTAYLNLASVLNAKHQSKEALETVNRLLALNKGAERSPDVQCNRGIALIELGRVEEGTQLLSAIVQQKPDHRMSHVVLGMVYSQTNQPRRAIPHYQQAVQLQPDPKIASLMHAAEVAAHAGEAQ
ncbi:MAG: hypothetical protein JWO08_615, partial [Verrucomicrobiaceae bacterium]|nr:hypothetical protein [Verrucomicrobiaceae bacterium]